MATTVLILQHGEKESHPGDPGLTARGRRQVDLAAAALSHRRPAAIVSSPLLRARQTAQPLATLCGLSLRIDPRLAERMNLEEGQDFQRFIQAWQTTIDDREWSPSGGRSSRMTAADFREAINDQAMIGHAIVVASHGGATVDLLRDLLGDKTLEERAPGIVLNGLPGAAITTLTRRHDAWLVTSIGSTDHLPVEDQTGHILF